MDEHDALYARALAMMVVGSHGRVQLQGTPWECFIAERDGLTLSWYPNRTARLMLLTIHAPDCVLETEFANLTDERPVVLHHVPGPWQQRLFKAAKPRLRWRDRTRWTAPWKRNNGWPFNHVA
jgi:hypothetical protein